MNQGQSGNGQTGAVNVARCIDALRRGWPISIGEKEGQICLIAVERFADGTVADDSILSIMISDQRAATLKLGNQAAVHASDKIGAAVHIKRPADFNASLAMAIADPTLDLRHPMKGPFKVVEGAHPILAHIALNLAREAGLLPAFLQLNDDVTPLAQMMADDFADYSQSEHLNIAVRAKLPVSASEDAQIVAFRAQSNGAEHIALLIGKPNGKAPIVRLHSECLTGDVLGSLKCDCGPQLHNAMHQMAHGDWGILLYLRQEGRGIGLVNKLRAYALQDQGFDTVDANLRLGFAVDARDFSVAARMLKLLGAQEIRLLTNNPKKVAGLQAEGIKVVERLAIKVGENPFNIDYLNTKRDRTEHIL
ncbi:GTP cyclohydrolase II [Sphingorhabdus lutea]|uniref:GTP cyclohydrolase-2 n=1 Tax=Sphingorhabdus lutea TaxID=1913578 RepID=A0A1L3JDM9_9SPHN|nr:GTP cyclohydrolase II [Sphingorhabdus lutea]APG63257.1 GTP cyclohydrolase II [Sphingorhabdus lutea]